MQLVSGGTASGFVLGSGAMQQIAGGTAIATVIGSGASQQIQGGVASNAQIDKGGTQIVEGEALSSLVEKGGNEVLLSGGTAIGTDLEKGGSVFVISGTTSAFVGGGSVITSDEAIVLSAGVLEKASAGTLAKNLIVSGETEYVLAGATASAVHIQSGGLLQAHSGASVLLATVSGGTLTATNTVVSGGKIEAHGTVTLSAASLAEAIQIKQFGVLNASTGTQLVGDVVSAHGTQNVDRGATASKTVLSGGTEAVNGGLAVSTTIDVGGTQYVGGVGSAVATTVMAGGLLLDEGLTNGVVLQAGSIEQVIDVSRANATLVDSGADLQVESGATTSATTIMAGGTMDLTSFLCAQGGSATLNAVDQLIVVEGYQTETIQLAGNYTGEAFHVAADSGSGTLITVSAAQNTDPSVLHRDIGGVTSAVGSAVSRMEVATGGAVLTETAASIDAFGHDLLPQIQ